MRFYRAAGLLLLLAACGDRAADRESEADEVAAQLGVNEQAAAAQCLQPGDMQASEAELQGERGRRLITCLNQEEVRQIRQRLPFSRDGLTLTAISADGLVLTHEFVADAEAANVPEAQRRDIETQARAALCGGADTSMTIRVGKVYAYIYRDRAGAEITRFRVDRC